MREVGILEAKTHLSALVEEVSAGAEIMITRHGRPVARLAPPSANRRPDADAAAKIRALRDAWERDFGADPAFDWKAAVEEGRR